LHLHDLDHVQVEGRLLVGRFDGQHGVHADLGQHVGNLEIIKLRLVVSTSRQIEIEIENVLSVETNF